MEEQQNSIGGAFSGAVDDHDDMSHCSGDGDDPSLGFLSDDDVDESPDAPGDSGNVEGDTAEEPSYEIPSEIDMQAEQGATATEPFSGSTARTPTETRNTSATATQQSDSTETSGAATGDTNMPPPAVPPSGPPLPLIPKGLTT